MTCEREELLSRYIDGDLGAQESAEMRRHIATCRECQEMYHETTRREKAVRDTLAAVITAMPLRESVMKRILAERLAPESAPKTERPAGSRSPILAWALALVIVVAASAMLYLTATNRAQVRNTTNMVVLMGLQDGSTFGRKSLPAREMCFAPVGMAAPIQGTFALFLHGTKREPTLLDGSATLQLDFSRITWLEGEATIVSAQNHDIVVRLGEEELLLKNARISLKGSPASYQTTLNGGTAYRFRGGRVEALPLAASATPATASAPVREHAIAPNSDPAELPSASKPLQSIAPDAHPVTDMEGIPASAASIEPTSASQTASAATTLHGEAGEPVRNPFITPQIPGAVGE
ncbi:MAG TPA: anti-sigma factor [Candidatus Ozemobacteraceae bacterium]|nr:anti-sigma factor [Candidatus Ozemobacteraceae bacterium]